MLRYGVLAAAVALASGQASQACLSDPGSCFDCDESIDFLRGVRYSQIVVSQMGTQGGHHDEQVLLCQNRCLRAYNGQCTGFFYQQHNNGNCAGVDRTDRSHQCDGHQICGFYTTDISETPDAGQNHRRGSQVCFRTRPPTRPPTPPPTSPPTPPPTPPPTRPPTTLPPTTRPPSPAPTPEPSAGPTRHACADGTHGCDTTSAGICERIDNTAGYRCSCAPNYHCSDGGCTTAAHTCVLNTRSPTRSPSSAPSGTPSTTPTPAPTLAPTQAPTQVYATNSGGQIIFPTDSAGNEVLVTDQNRQFIIPTNGRGQLVLPSTTAPPTTDFPTSLGDGNLNPDGTSGANADGSKTDEEEALASSSTVVIAAVIAVTLIIIVVIILGAMYTMRKRSNDAGRPSAFDNPLYADASPPAAPAQMTHQTESAYADFLDVPQNATSGYMDVPASTSTASAASGYMDVAPAFDHMAEAEDV